MKYRCLGRTNLRVSVIGIGTWQLGGEWGKNFAQDEVDRMLRRGKELGLNLIDTAECYGDHLSESFVGKAIERDRREWILATKFGHKFISHQNREDKRSARDMEKQLDDSLRALQTDYVDILQYHSIRDEEFDDVELQKALQRAVKSGKVRHIGNSIAAGIDNNHQAECSVSAGVDLLQVVYNRLARKHENLSFPTALRDNLGVLARVPLASGFLSGKYKAGAKFTSNDFRATKKQDEIDRQLKEVEEIRKNEIPPGVNMAQWALAWCLRHPAVTAVIPGCKSVEQVEQNAKAAELVASGHPQEM